MGSSLGIVKDVYEKRNGMARIFQAKTVVTGRHGGL